MAFFFLVVMLHGCVNLKAVGKFADGTEESRKNHGWERIARESLKEVMLLFD
jgi:hypothetical protein